MFFYNANYLLYMIPAILLTMLAQFFVNSSYRRWSQVRNSSGMTGLDIARRLIQSSGLYNVNVEMIAGKMTDHYDPSSNILRLSPGVAQGDSVAAIAIAAHELGHAMQDKEQYFPLKFRAALVPMVNIGSTLGWVFIMVGLIFSMTNLAWLGVLFFSGGALFSLATLPVELNASHRAKQMLQEANIITNSNESRGVNQVLNAAALTYVAALFTAIMQLLYFISLVSGRGRRR
ncbi:MAG: zinc metallopeptidase [Anaerolineales bacterium]|nr:zinc metallopeptidase [Anaerolineales bacterium]